MISDSVMAPPRSRRMTGPGATRPFLRPSLSTSSGSSDACHYRRTICPRCATSVAGSRRKQRSGSATGRRPPSVPSSARLSLDTSSSVPHHRSPGDCGRLATLKSLRRVIDESRGINESAARQWRQVFVAERPCRPLGRMRGGDGPQPPPHRNEPAKSAR